MQYFPLQHHFTFTTRHIYNWASFLLWLSHFILSGAISNCHPLFLNNILYTFQPWGLIFQGHLFRLFLMPMGFSKQKYCSEFPFPPLKDHVFSELFTVSHSPWVTLHGIAQSFTELHEPLCHEKFVTYEGDKRRQVVNIPWFWPDSEGMW